MKISVIIPVLNEAEHITDLVVHCRRHTGPETVEVIVVDGGSTDETVARARLSGARVLHCPQRGRARQMNYGASVARGEILYFIHADTIPPASFAADLFESVQMGYPIGCYRFRFDGGPALLRINAFFTRFDRLWCRGGDQTLFITRRLFDELGGYRSDYIIMEEFDLITRARSKAPFRIIPKDAIVSARKYQQNGYVRVQFANWLVFNMYRWGYSQETLAATYRRLLKYRS